MYSVQSSLVLAVKHIDTGQEGLHGLHKGMVLTHRVGAELNKGVLDAPYCLFRFVCGRFEADAKTRCLCCACIQAVANAAEAFPEAARLVPAEHLDLLLIAMRCLRELRSILADCSNQQQGEQIRKEPDHASKITRRLVRPHPQL